MIVTEKKDIKDILKYLKKTDDIFIIGCAQCATSCNTGGEKEVFELKQQLEEKDFNIIGFDVIDPPCDQRIVKLSFKKQKDIINRTDVFIVLACGAGINVISELTEKKRIIAGLNGLYLGSVKRLGQFNEYCSLCGECVVSKTGGICPVTRCSKHLLNGPCGGVVDGEFCELDNTKKCVWVEIINKLKELNQTDLLFEVLDNDKKIN
jgi:ferredoxin